MSSIVILAVSNKNACLFCTVHVLKNKHLLAVLHSEKQSSDDSDPGKGHADVTFPRMNELRDFVTAESVTTLCDHPRSIAG